MTSQVLVINDHDTYPVYVSGGVNRVLEPKDRFEYVGDDALLFEEHDSEHRRYAELPACEYGNGIVRFHQSGVFTFHMDAKPGDRVESCLRRKRWAQFLRSWWWLIALIVLLLLGVLFWFVRRRSSRTPAQVKR